MKQRARASTAIAVAASLVCFAANADEAQRQRQSADEVSADSSERSVLGVRGSYTESSVSGTGDHGAGLVLTGFGDAFRGQGALSARASHLFAIGGGTAGFEGALAGLIAVGLRVPTGRRGGLFLRGAVRGELLGNDLFYTSRLELPEGQLGYQFVSADVRFEAGVSLAPVLVGRFRIADQSRNLGGTLAMGGFATLQPSAPSSRWKPCGSRSMAPGERTRSAWRRLARAPAQHPSRCAPTCARSKATPLVERRHAR